MTQIKKLLIGPLYVIIGTGELTKGCKLYAYSPESQTTYQVDSPAIPDPGSRRDQGGLYIPEIDNQGLAVPIAGLKASYSQLSFTGHQQRAPV